LQGAQGLLGALHQEGFRYLQNQLSWLQTVSLQDSLEVRKKTRHQQGGASHVHGDRKTQGGSGGGGLLQSQAIQLRHHTQLLQQGHEAGGGNQLISILQARQGLRILHLACAHGNNGLKIKRYLAAFHSPLHLLQES